MPYAVEFMPVGLLQLMGEADILPRLKSWDSNQGVPVESAAFGFIPPGSWGVSNRPRPKHKCLGPLPFRERHSGWPSSELDWFAFWGFTRQSRNAVPTTSAPIPSGAGFITFIAEHGSARVSLVHGPPHKGNDSSHL